MEKIFDSHSHYNNSAFSEDYDALMQHLKDSDVGYVMNCGSSVEASKKALHTKSFFIDSRKEQDDEKTGIWTDASAQERRADRH